MAAVMAPATSNMCSVVPRKSSSVKYRPQNRRTVAGATQYSTKIAMAASRNASGDCDFRSHLKCMRADHRANHGRHASSLLPSGKIAGNCAIPSQRRCM